MSGICALVSFDRSIAPCPAIKRMMRLLERRGPDAAAHWGREEVALGHALLATTPEAELEKLPFRDPATGCVITADARIDNRDDLIRALDIERSAHDIGDGALILAAYLRWGDLCACHLLGDFAFAIWDPRVKRLFCARDQMGMRQLLFAPLNKHTLCVATDAAPIRALAPDRFAVSDARIADYLADLEGIDQTSTFFEGLQRLQPAHTLSFDDKGVSIKRYWRLAPKPLLHLQSDKDYDEAFLAIFREAVRCRLRSNRPVGAMLSGGQDSTAIAAIAAEINMARGGVPLKTFSAVGPDPETCVETRSVHAARSILGIAPTLIDYSQLGDLLPEIVAQIKQMDEPFDGPMNLIRAVYTTARHAGVRVVLDGVAADTILTAGDHRGYMLRHGHVRRALRDIEGELTFWGGGPSPWIALAGAAWRAFVPAGVKKLRRALMLRQQTSQLPDSSLVSEVLAKRVNLPDRQLRYLAQKDNAADPQLGSILHYNLTVGRERYDRVAGSIAIEPRDPFMDLRMIEFCLSLPPDQLTAEGWPKLILRRAMAGKLPDAVRWRRGRQHLGLDFTDAVLSGWAGWRRSNPQKLLAMGCEAGSVAAFEEAAKQGAAHFNTIRELIWLLAWERSINRAIVPETRSHAVVTRMPNHCDEDTETKGVFG
jgi:asparagine synthase (glutamine-hydrolysing)